ncbi:unnamed protein product [Pylaiella littoralis]
MACEARIIRVLRALEYPWVDDLATTPGLGSAAPLSLGARPHDLAKIVSWIEDRKVRDLAIPDREPLRTPGPGWESAFFSYLQGTGCPYDFTPTPGTRAGGGDEEGRTGPSDGSDSNLVLRGLSWLSSEAVAREFEDDNGKDYKGAARRLLSTIPRPSPPRQPEKSGQPLPPEEPVTAAAAAAAAAGIVATDDDGFEDGKKVFHELKGFAAGVETGNEACNSVATVLRMMFLSDLRDLQDEVNGVIALAQSSRTKRTS